MSSTLTTLTRLFRRYGQTYHVMTAGAGRDMLGLIAPMSTAEVGVYFDGNEAVGLLKPSYTLHVPGSEGSPPVVNDLFFFAGRLLTVRKTHDFAIGSERIVTIALCD